MDERAVLAPGTRRQAKVGAMAEMDDFEEEPLQKWLDGEARWAEMSRR